MARSRRREKGNPHDQWTRGAREEAYSSCARESQCGALRALKRKEGRDGVEWPCSCVAAARPLGSGSSRGHPHCPAPVGALRSKRDVGDASLEHPLPAVEDAELIEETMQCLTGGSPVQDGHAGWADT
jgi:hypothetical protein